MEESGKIRDAFTFSANGLTITNIDIQSVEPVDQKTRDSLQKSVQMAIEIVTKSQYVGVLVNLTRTEWGRAKRQPPGPQESGLAFFFFEGALQSGRMGRRDVQEFCCWLKHPERRRLRFHPVHRYFSREASARHEAERKEQGAKGKLERQVIQDKAQVRRCAVSGARAVKLLGYVPMISANLGARILLVSVLRAGTAKFFRTTWPPEGGGGPTPPTQPP